MCNIFLANLVHLHWPTDKKQIGTKNQYLRFGLTPNKDVVAPSPPPANTRPTGRFALISGFQISLFSWWPFWRFYTWSESRCSPACLSTCINIRTVCLNVSFLLPRRPRTHLTDITRPTKTIFLKKYFINQHIYNYRQSIQMQSSRTWGSE